MVDFKILCTKMNLSFHLFSCDFWEVPWIILIYAQLRLFILQASGSVRFVTLSCDLCSSLLLLVPQIPSIQATFCTVPFWVLP